MLEYLFSFRGRAGRMKYISLIIFWALFPILFFMFSIFFLGLLGKTLIPFVVLTFFIAIFFSGL